jgi:hypothetical protein
MALLQQVFVRRYDTKLDVHGLNVEYHYDSSCYTLVLQLGGKKGMTSGGDIIVDLNGSCSSSRVLKGKPDISDIETPVCCKMQPGDSVICTRSCRHKTAPPSTGARWTLVVFYGFC